MVKYRAAMLMAVVAIVFVVIHFYTGWEAAIEEAASHQQPAVFSDYIVEWIRDTAENLQSEFWQLAVQFALLAGFFEFMRVHAYEEDLVERQACFVIPQRSGGISRSRSADRQDVPEPPSISSVCGPRREMPSPPLRSGRNHN